ncbi:MAG: TfoX/Sxy family DNA transformation protein [Oscillospiraceae bacterium]|nr:TfoX/Sxy family DNA transformation protein [Oscillospiraceae bacterium]
MAELMSMMNIGSEMARKLKSVGIDSCEALIETGAKRAFIRLKTAYPNVCLVHLYVLEGAVRNTEFNNLSGDTKKDLKLFSDSLKDCADNIGKIVTVTVDRPLGSYHPEHKDMYYPLNYGYIEGIIAPDGEEQDAYILGVDKAVEKFTGKIIAVIHRFDDVEEKWVVCPENQSFSKEKIEELVEFQEKYYHSEIIM